MNARAAPATMAVLLLAFGLLATPVTWALGLGEARVESYMQQPLEARVRLISRSEAELATVTASLASAEDYRVIGLDRATLSVPLTFEVIADLDDPHILVRSQLPISEPVVQLVLEVVWASGRMLRQYTLFLDPPAVDAVAPLPEPSPVRSASQPRPETNAPEPVTPEPGPASQAMTDSEPLGEAEPVAQTELRPVVVPASSGADAGQYGPVQRGETLWRIASRLAREQGISVNQMMLAIQQRNPGAFNNGNINSLLAGSVLRLPTRDEVLGVDQREAAQEVARQNLSWRNARGNRVTPTKDLPVIADIDEAASGPPLTASGESESAQDDGGTGSAGEVAEGRLELVPPASNDAQSAEAGTGNAGEQNEEGSVSVVEELARAQEELANAQLENEYLNERIQELESELARREQSGTEIGLVEDSGLSEMEARLREQRLSGESSEVQVIPPQEERPWLARWTPWVFGVVLLAILGVVWWLRGRRASDDRMQEITEEAEDILRVLGDDQENDEMVPRDIAPLRTPRVSYREEEAVELDADDPETKLDLARAYLSMGDLGAARRILDDVLDSGDEEQIAEARRMMQEL